MISALRTRRILAIENLLLRQQLAVYKQGWQRPRLTDADRAFWTIVASIGSQWREAIGTEDSYRFLLRIGGMEFTSRAKGRSAQRQHSEEQPSRL